MSVSHQYLRDSERPATLLALWKSKRETDSTRRFYLYFSESVSAGLPRPEPFVPLDASAGDAATASDGDDAVHDLTASDGSSALQTLKRLVGAGGGKSKSGDSGASKSPPKSPPVSPRQPQRVVSPAPTSKANAPAVSASPTSTSRAVAKPSRSLTEAAVLKSKIESPYRTIPSDLWSDAAEQDTAPTPAPAAASAPAAAPVASMPSSDMQFLEDLLNQPIAGGVDDLRALEAARQAEPKDNDDDDNDDDDGFRMSLIDRPNDEFMKTIKLSDVAPPAEKPAAKARASVEYDADTLDKLAASWLESAAGDAAPAATKKAPVAAIASIDQMLAGLDDGDGDPLQLQAISAPPEVDDSAYCQIPKGLSRPSFLKPAGQEPQLFAAKIQRITSQRKVEIEPALEDADELLAELAADENVQRALSPSEELSSWTQRASIHEAAAAAKSAAAAAKSKATAAGAPVEKDEWDFELELEQAQEQLAKELADLNR